MEVPVTQDACEINSVIGPPGSSCKHFAGRGPAGAADLNGVGLTVKKRGIRHVRANPQTGEEREIFAIGLACSESLTGPRLAKAMRPSFEAERLALEQLANDDFAGTLSVHTSAGVPPALPHFLQALEPHLPWPASDDWLASLQLEGGTAVFAGIDMLLQLQKVRGQIGRVKVAVAERSYHGPPATAPGAPAAPLFPKQYQVVYPAPTILRESDDELEAEFRLFLEECSSEVGVILFEPQWGSSNAAKPWPPILLQKFIDLSHDYGLLVLCDEIMCGLARHGHGCCFLSEAWNLNVDAVTFGKAMAAGVFPISGAILRCGAQELGQAGRGVMHMHTYAGSSQQALLTAIEVLKTLPELYKHIHDAAELIRQNLQRLESETQGFLRCQGQGLMWAGIFSGSEEERSKSLKELRKECITADVWPYFVPIGGFMVTPPLDVAHEDLQEGLTRLSKCLHHVATNRVAYAGC